MRDLIDRTELVDRLKSAIAIIKSMTEYLHSEDDPEIKMEIKTYTDILNRVNKMSPVQPESKIGQWIHKGRGCFECNQCGKLVASTVYRDAKISNCFKFCPECGAKMVVIE